MQKYDISDPQIEKDELGNIKRVYIQFGPHYFIDLMPNGQGEVSLYVGATHHGFSAAAGEVGGQLEKIIEEIRQTHPELAFD